jgi:RNA polymerase sigma-70 factor, ECF subfamily
MSGLDASARFTTGGLAAPADFDAAEDAPTAALELETALIERVQRGDVAAFGQLVEVHQNAAQRMAMLLGLSPDDAADAVQEAFVRAYRAIARFTLGKPFRPWLTSIVVNEVRGLHRRAGRRARLAEKVAALPHVHAEGPEIDNLRHERTGIVLEALARLREHDRLPIIYRYFLEFSEAEIADALRVPRGTVKSRLSRALVRLRHELGGERP